MSFIRFNHVFAVLMVLSFISAFVLPRAVEGWQDGSSRLEAHVRGVFAPVAWPFHRLGTWAQAAFLADEPADRRPEAELIRENDFLRTELVRLMRELEELQALNADRELLGDLRKHCTPMAVVGADSGNRESLLLRPLVQMRIEDDLPVICPSGLVGRLDRIGAGAAARVRLVTDVGFRLTGSFRRFVENPDGTVQVIPLALPTPQLVEGMGKGRLAIRTLTERQVADLGLQRGDWVVIDDREYEGLQGLKIGRVTAIRPRPDAPQFAQVELEPMQNLKLLREVMVFDRR